MNRFVTTLLFACLTCLAIMPAKAQDAQQVTIRQLTELTPARLDSLNQIGADLTMPQIEELIENELFEERVQITGVVLSNPRNSGLSSATDGFPTRIHIFVRDTSAATQGNAGMGIQIVDDQYQTTGTLNLAVGDVITVTGAVIKFGTALQVDPESITLEGPYQSFGLPDSILDPVEVTTAEANRSLGGGQVQVNWDNLGDLRGQHVRIENATVLVRDISDTERPNFLITTDGGETVLNFYDVSLRYRNDRGSAYNNEEFNVRTSDDGDFFPPPAGSLINLEGFINFQGDDPFARGVPDGALLSIIPFDDEDLEIIEAPPIISNLSFPDFVPAADPVTITVDVVADPSRELTDVTFHYFTSADPDTVSVAATAGAGDSFSAEIPAVDDGEFVTYFVTAEDNTGAQATSEPQMYRVLVGGINQIADIQITIDEGPGDSPFHGVVADMDITATVQSAPGFGGSAVAGFSVQDDPDFGPWSGVLIEDSDATTGLEKGDVIHITSAEVDELFGVTILRDVTFEETGSGEILGYKTISTDALQSSSVAEAHEGMLVRFEDVVITDADAGFGEWAFSSDGTTDNQVFADDASLELTSSFASDTFTDGDVVEFIQGVWWFSFGAYKLVPESIADVGAIIVSAEDEAVPHTFALEQNYPNPFNPATTIRYGVPEAANVSLRVFDMLGREVRVLVDEQQAPGVYDVTFDAVGLASGVYLYKLTAGQKTKSHTMLLLK